MGPLLRIYLNLLNKKQRIRLLAIMIMGLFAAALEVLGVHLMLPVLSIISNADEYQHRDYFSIFDNFFPSIFGNPIIGTFAVVALFFAFKAISLILLSYIKNSAIGAIRREIGNRIFVDTLCSDYLSFVKNQNATLLNNLTVGVNHLTHGVLLSVVNILSELIIVISIVVFIVVETSIFALFPPMIIAILALGIAILLRAWASRVGTIRVLSEQGRIETINRTIRSFLEIKIYGSSAHFAALLDKNEKRYKKATAEANTIGEIPKYSLEFLGVATILCFLVLSGNWLNDKSIDIEQGGLFVVGIIKLIPSLSKIIASANSLRISLPSFIAIEEHFQLSKNTLIAGSKPLPKKQNITKIQSITFENIGFSYDKDVTVISQPNKYEFFIGELNCIIGASGRGKSTLLNILCGAIVPDVGSIKINNLEIPNYLEEITGRIGYVPQDLGLFNKTVAENVAFDESIEDINKDMLHWALNEANAYDFVEKLRKREFTVLADNGQNLSGGQRQRLALARSLYKNPDIIVLDEATNALDKITERRFLETMRKIAKEKIVVLVSHDKSIQKFCQNSIEL